MKSKIIPLLLAVMFLLAACSNGPIQDETTQPTTEENLSVAVPAEEFYKADLTVEGWKMSEDMKSFYIGDESNKALTTFEEEFAFADTISRTYEVTLDLSENERYLHTQLLVYDSGRFEPTHENDLMLHSLWHIEPLATVWVWVPESYVEDFYSEFTHDKILERAGLVAVEETDKNNRIKAEQMFTQYWEQVEEDRNVLCLGRYDTIYGGPDSGSRFIVDGYVYCYIDGHFFYVDPKAESIYSCHMESDMAVVWKNGIAWDETKATQFAKSILGDRAEGCEGELLEGYYIINLPDVQMFFVNWTCDKIYISTDNTGYVDTLKEIYPDDTVGFFDK